MIKLKRIYDKYEKDDGYRILVDRLWPRGMTKQKAKIDLWLKDIAPSNELRKWFNHNDLRWHNFQKKYKKELSDNKELLEIIKDKVKRHGTITLIFAAKDTLHNNAVVLNKLLNRKNLPC
jgi:uncharacterized protein YeaO (DUF488 family)